MTAVERNALRIKIQQLDEFHRASGRSYAEVSRLFDQYDIWSLVDDAYEGFHVQGAAATYEDLVAYLTTKGALA